jgi:hypothetical protein
MYKSAAWLLLVLLYTALVQCDCGEEGLGGSPQLEVDSSILQFTDVAVGYPQTRILQISNTGRAGLVLEQVEVQNQATGSFSVLGILRDDTIQEMPNSIAPLSSIDLIVEYEPASDTAVDSEILDLITNDPDQCSPATNFEANPCEIQLTGNGAPPEAKLEVVCQEDELCPDELKPCEIIKDTVTNTIDVSAKLNFCEVSAGQHGQRSLLFVNKGNIPLQMGGWLDLLPNPVGEEMFSVISSQDGQVDIEPNSDSMFSLKYSPQESGVHGAKIYLQTNVSDLPNNEFSVFVSGKSFEPDIDVSPTHLSFDGVVIGNPETEEITIKNVGTGTLVVSGLELTGSEEYSLSTTDGFNLAPDEDKIIEVTYDPIDAGQDNATIHIHSNDPDQAIVAVTLGADVSRPDLEVTPGSMIEFSAASGADDSQLVSMQNIGQANLMITAIELTINPGDPPVFELQDLPADFPANAIILAPQEAQEFSVVIHDNPALLEQGQLEITHDSPNDTNPYVLSLFNDTEVNHPPIAMINPPSVTQTGFASVVLDGSGSLDIDDGDSVTSYEWSFSELASDAQGNQSQAVLDSTDQVQTSFTPDMTGVYKVQLIVYDTQNTPSQPVEATVSIN